MTSSYGVVIQARASSSRLPGKVLLPVAGKPMLQHQIERLRAGISDWPIIVATSTDVSDNPVRELCLDLEIPVFRGSLTDVAGRLRDTAREFNLTHIVRVGGDDPLADPDCCKSLIRTAMENPLDFVFASHKRGWPYGTSSDLISLAALETLVKETNDSIDREHTLPYLLRNSRQFSSAWLLAPTDIRESEIRVSVDFKEDFSLVTEIFTHFRRSPDFTTAALINFLNRNPELQNRNATVQSGFSF